MRAALVAALILLAGCSEPEAPEVIPAAPTDTSSSPAPVAEPTVEVVPFSFDGNLGTVAHACVFPAGQCTNGVVVEGSTDLFLDRPGANLTGLRFEVTWQAQSPATQELRVGSMVMATCDGCNSTSFEETQGPSPISVDVQGVSVPLTDDARVHIYVYNPQGFVYDPAVPGYALVSMDEPFHVEGTATFVVPPAPTAAA